MLFAPVIFLLMSVLEEQREALGVKLKSPGSFSSEADLNLNLVPPEIHRPTPPPGSKPELESGPYMPGSSL